MIGAAIMWMVQSQTEGAYLLISGKKINGHESVPLLHLRKLRTRVEEQKGKGSIPVWC